MTNEEAAAMLERMKNYFLPTSPMLEERREITALDLAISALSKQSASSEQADHIAEPGKMIKLKKRTITERLIIAESLINSVIADSDQFREDTKMTDDVLINLPSAQPETNCSEIPNNSGLISRQMAIDDLKDKDPSQIWDTADIEVWINALPSAQPEIKTGGDTISRQMAIDIVEFECGEWSGLAKTIAGEIEQLPSAQPEVIRCTECKHYREYDSEYVENAVVVQCMADRYPISETIPDGWFCAGAERKDDE